MQFFLATINATISISKYPTSEKSLSKNLMKISLFSTTTLRKNIS